MSFTDQKPFVVTEQQVTAPWGGHRDGRNFRCAWCGHHFKIGDVARWVFTNDGQPDTKGLSGNPFICSSCDGPREQILARLQQLREEVDSEKYWWVIERRAVKLAEEMMREQERWERQNRGDY